MKTKLLVPISEIHFSFARGSGPGGQNVNKVNSKAILAWDIAQSPSLDPQQRSRFFAKFGSRVNRDGVFILMSDRFRDQGRNVNDCLVKLQSMLDQIEMEPKPRRVTKPTRAAKRRRLDEKRKAGEKKKERRKFFDD